MKPAHLRSILFGLLLAQAIPAAAQEPAPPEKKLGWHDKAELALVVTAGNSETSTFGFRNLLSRTWTDAELKFEVSGLRTETATFTEISIDVRPEEPRLPTATMPWAAH